MPAQFDPYLDWLQVSSSRRPPTHYDLLGLPAFSNDSNAVQAAARDRIAHVRKYQAGKHSEVAIRLMHEISQAMTCLTDPLAKDAYDRELRGFETIEQAAVQELSATIADTGRTHSEAAPLPQELVGTADQGLEKLSAVVDITEPPSGAAVVSSASNVLLDAQRPTRTLPWVPVVSSLVAVMLLVGMYGMFRLFTNSKPPADPSLAQIGSESSIEPVAEEGPPGTEDALAPSVSSASPTNPGANAPAPPTGAAPMPGTTAPPTTKTPLLQPGVGGGWEGKLAEIYIDAARPAAHLLVKLDQPAGALIEASSNDYGVFLALMGYLSDAETGGQGDRVRIEGSPLSSQGLFIQRTEPLVVQLAALESVHAGQPGYRVGAPIASLPTLKLKSPLSFLQRIRPQLGLTYELTAEFRSSVFDPVRRVTLVSIVSGALDLREVPVQFEAGSFQAFRAGEVVVVQAEVIDEPPPKLSLRGVHMRKASDPAVQVGQQRPNVTNVERNMAAGQALAGRGLGGGSIPGISLPTSMPAAGLGLPQPGTASPLPAAPPPSPPDPAVAQSRQRWSQIYNNPSLFIGQTGTLTGRFLSIDPGAAGAVLVLDFAGQPATFQVPAATITNVRNGFRADQIVDVEYSISGGLPSNPLVQLVTLAIAGKPETKISLVDPNSVPSGGVRPLFTLTERGASVQHVAWSPDGSRLATAGAQCTVWDASTGIAEHTLPESLNVHGELRFNSNSKALSLVNSSREWKLYDLASETLSVSYRLSTVDNGYRTAICPNGEVVVASAGPTNGASGTYWPVLVWDSLKNRQSDEIKNLSYVQSVAVSPDGRYLLVATSQWLQLYKQAGGKWSTPQQVAPLPGIMGLWWLPGPGHHFAALSATSQLAVADAESPRRPPPSYFTAQNVLPPLSWSSDGKQVAMLSRGHYLVQNLAGKPANPAAAANPVGIGVVNPATSNCVAAVFSPLGNLLALGFLDGRIVLRDEDAGEEVLTIASGMPITALAWSPQGDRLASVHYGAVNVWDTSKHVPEGLLPASKPAAAGPIRAEIAKGIKDAQKAIIEKDWPLANRLALELEAADLNSTEKKAVALRIRKALSDHADRLVQQAKRLKTQDPAQATRLLKEALEIDPDGPGGKQAAQELGPS